MYYQAGVMAQPIVIPPPPSGDVFGPTAGAEAVRTEAGARPVANPGVGTSFTSPSDLQTKINAGATGAIYVAANNMTWTSLVQTGSKAPKIYFPTPIVINGGGNTGITGLRIDTGAELHGGTWTNFQSEHPPVGTQGSGPLGTGAAKLVQDVISHGNFGKGFNVAGSNTTMDHLTSYNNGRYGIGSNQPQNLGADSYITNVVWQYVEWYNNNSRNLPTDADAGGSKLLHAFPTTVQYCWSHHNTGAGLWMDYNPGNHIIRENVCELNTVWGIFYEVGTSYGAGNWKAEANVHNNYLKDNCTGAVNSWYSDVQLLSSCSDGQLHGGTGHDFHHNLIDGVKKAVGFVDHNCHPTDVRSCRIHDNDIWIRATSPDGAGKVGGQQNADCANPPGLDPFAAAQGNTFENNHYHVPAGSLGQPYWRWAGSNRTWAQWQSLGHDNTGTLVAI